MKNSTATSHRLFLYLIFTLAICAIGIQPYTANAAQEQEKEMSTKVLTDSVVEAGDQHADSLFSAHPFHQVASLYERVGEFRPVAVFDDYHQGAGEMDEGVWRVHLTAQEALWQPRGEGGPSLRAFAFSADGGPPQAPAPMIRVAAGTPVEVVVTNTLADTLFMLGLAELAGTEAAEAPNPRFHEPIITLLEGETDTLRFMPQTEGSFYYTGWSGYSMGPNAILLGPLIVDPPGETPPLDERVMLISGWSDAELDPSTAKVTMKMMINGRSWPETERLHYTVGDTVRWRVINASITSHPMHLHGFYFRVDARGDQVRHVTYPPNERQEVVTERLDIDETMRITWIPETPGNWLFHCHLMRHMSPMQRFPDEPSVGGHGESQGHDTSNVAIDHARDGMAGMIMGITVQPDSSHIKPEAAVERRLSLFTSRRDSTIDHDPAYSFVLQEGNEPPRINDVQIPGSPLILTRGEMTKITVHNRLEFPFGVHWHGLELASHYDGVADWSGMPGRAIPPIAPGDSFAVRIQPPRAGTFIYHVHSEPGHQLAQGMYGPLVVLEPGESFDPDHDRIFVLASEGTTINAQRPVVNGVFNSEPLEFRAGEEYRLRFINISSDDFKTIRLIRAGEAEQWKVIAKDGADLPASLMQTSLNVLELGVGETIDVLFTPENEAGQSLVIDTHFYPVIQRESHEVRIPMHVY